MKMTISVFMKENNKEKSVLVLKNKKINWLIIISIVILLVDQVIKALIVSKLYNSSVVLIPNILNLTYVENTGAAFGIGSSSTAMFIIVNIIVIGLIVYFIYSKKEELSKTILFALHLILAGGIGNLIDRIVRGFVVDYIDINPIFKFPVFNLADICVTLGCIIVVIYLIINIIKERRRM